MIWAIVLSGGKSERMGNPKALLRLQGTTFLDRILDAIRDSSLAGTCIVVGHHRREIEAAFPAQEFVFNPDYAQGMSTSIQAGIRALPEGVEAAMLFLVDHPMVGALTIEGLLKAFRPGGIVVPVHAGRRGHPVLFSRDVLDEILSLPPDQGANTVVRRDPSRIIEVPVDDPGILIDVDTPEQYSALGG